MYWVAVIGFCAVLCLIVATFILLYKGKKHSVELPDGDYVIRVEEVRETLRGTETVYIIEEPKRFEGQRIVIAQGK